MDNLVSKQNNSGNDVYSVSTLQFITREKIKGMHLVLSCISDEVSYTRWKREVISDIRDGNRLSDVSRSEKIVQTAVDIFDTAMLGAYDFTSIDSPKDRSDLIKAMDSIISFSLDTDPNYYEWFEVSNVNPEDAESFRTASEDVEKFTKCVEVYKRLMKYPHKYYRVGTSIKETGK